MAEIQRADDRSQKLAIIAVILVLIGGIVLWMVLDEWMVEVRSLPVEAATQSVSRVLSCV